jgi:hypothetical protein
LITFLESAEDSENETILDEEETPSGSDIEVVEGIASLGIQES